ALRVAAPAPRAALDRQSDDDRLGGRARRGARARPTDRGPLLAVDRPAEDRALARCVRARLPDAHPAPRLRVGAWPAGTAAGRSAQGDDRRGAAGRVPALDVLRGPEPEDR